MAISDTLKQKAGPLPVWAWGVILGVVVVAASYWYSSKSKASSAGDGADGGAGSLVAYPDLDGGNGDGSGSNSGTVVTGTDAPTSSAPQFSSNAAWMTYVVAKLTAEGNSPLTTQVALLNYLSGKPLSAAEQALVNQAIGRFGLPPNGVDMIPTLNPEPVPVKTPVTKPAPVNDAPAPGYTSQKDQFGLVVPIVYGQPNYSDTATKDYGKNYEAEWEKKNAFR